MNVTVREEYEVVTITVAEENMPSPTVETCLGIQGQKEWVERLIASASKGVDFMRGVWQECVVRCYSFEVQKGILHALPENVLTMLSQSVKDIEPSLKFRLETLLNFPIGDPRENDACFQAGDLVRLRSPQGQWLNATVVDPVCGGCRVDWGDGPVRAWLPNAMIARERSTTKEQNRA